MDLGLRNRNFIVTGATAGLGNAVLRTLTNEGAFVFGIARSADDVARINEKYERVQLIAGDISKEENVDKLLQCLQDKEIHGVFVNAGGPPARAFLETKIEDWDAAYLSLLRWKIDLVQKLLPKFLQQRHGRILFSESSTVKQPLQNLVLSNSIRLAVVGMAKTLSEEIADKGITVNVIAPGFHDTQAMQRLFVKKSETANISIEEAKEAFKLQTRTGELGNTDDFASLAAWLLSSKSRYITGQTFSVDGGLVKGVFG